jgi:hypothetical protein
MTQRKLSIYAANVLFTPTVITYGWILVGYVAVGLGAYLLCLFTCSRAGIFKSVSAWPILAKLALFGSPVHIAIALYFSRLPTDYDMLLPEVVYAAVAVAGGLSLRGRTF